MLESSRKRMMAVMNMEVVMMEKKKMMMMVVENTTHYSFSYPFLMRFVGQTCPGNRAQKDIDFVKNHLHRRKKKRKSKRREANGTST